jgi:hypothetical protein
MFQNLSKKKYYDFFVTEHIVIDKALVFINFETNQNII